jgi:hypothetical protein
MKKGGRLPTIVLAGLILITGIQSIQAGDITQPELKDTRNDSLKNWDILSGWFHEPTNNKEYLYVTIHMHALSRLSSTYNVNFTTGATLYELTVSITPFSIPQFQLITKDQHTKTQVIKGNIDFEDCTITFKIPKYSIPQLQPGTLLTNTHASSKFNIAQLLNENLLIYTYFTDAVYGSNYRIQY